MVLDFYSSLGVRFVIVNWGVAQQHQQSFVFKSKAEVIFRHSIGPFGSALYRYGWMPKGIVFLLSLSFCYDFSESLGPGRFPLRDNWGLEFR